MVTSMVGLVIHGHAFLPAYFHGQYSIDLISSRGVPTQKIGLEPGTPAVTGQPELAGRRAASSGLEREHASNSERLQPNSLLNRIGNYFCKAGNPGAGTGYSISKSPLRAESGQA